MRERVIVLKTIKFSEADLIVQALNPRGGRMNFMARGALRSQKRFSGGLLEPTHFLAVTYRPGRSRTDDEPLHQLEEAQLLRGFHGLRERYERLTTALSMLNLVLQVSQFGVEDSPELFDLLGNALEAAESSDQPETLRLQFEAKLLYVQGVLRPGVLPPALLQRPLKAHAQLELATAELQRAHSDIQLALQRYLSGLSPFGAEEALV